MNARDCNNRGERVYINERSLVSTFNGSRFGRLCENDREKHSDLVVLLPLIYRDGR